MTENGVLAYDSRSLPPVLWRAIDDAQGREVCGLIIEHGNRLSFRRLENLGSSQGDFWIHPDELDRVCRDITRKDGQIKALVHSHACSTTPSAADRALAARSPWPVLLVTAAYDVMTVSEGDS